MIQVSVIIVSYNTKEFLKDLIESLYKQTKDVEFEVIVSDNNSSDGTAKEIPEYFESYKNFYYIQNKVNLGFSKANNVGIKKSLGEYVLFLNPDTLILENTLKLMYDFMEETPDCGASTCKVVLPDGTLDDSCHRGFPTPWNSFCYFLGLSKMFPKSKIFSGYNLGNLDINSTHEIDALAGSFMFVRRKAGTQAKWWDEDYFFYGEDLDFCFMLKKIGWKVYYYPKTYIRHLKGVSAGIKKISKEISTADEKTKQLAKNERFKAMRIFYKKHYENKYPFAITRAVYLGIKLKKLIS